jgi:RimJ/RimL family protein N-acetyltransferase
MTMPREKKMTELPFASGKIRSWRTDDAESIAPLANNRKIWLNLRDRFPHPYTLEDARNFIRMAREKEPETLFAIEVDGKAIGGIGFIPGTDVERVSAEIGYWLGEPYWGRGIMTDVVKVVTEYAFEQFGFTRIWAVPYAWNAGSCKVLDKAGYSLECRMKKSAKKDGQIVDQFLYAQTR